MGPSLYGTLSRLSQLARGIWQWDSVLSFTGDSIPHKVPKWEGVACEQHEHGNAHVLKSEELNLIQGKDEKNKGGAKSKKREGKVADGQPESRARSFDLSTYIYFRTRGQSSRQSSGEAYLQPTSPPSLSLS